MAYRFNILNHRVSELAIIPKSDHVPSDSIIQLTINPSDSIIQLTFKACLVTLQHNSLTNRSSITNTSSRQITLEFDFSILENESQLNQTLAPYLNGLGINTGSVNYDNLIRDIMERGLGTSSRVVNRGVVLPLVASMITHYVEYNDDNLIRAVEVSEAELERRNYGMVAAKESSIEEMLKKVRVEEETDCTVCLEKLKVGMDVSRMPCAHIFHAYCIEKWLKQSHYCPICRYEMPTNDEIKI